MNDQSEVVRQVPDEFWDVIAASAQDPARFREYLHDMDREALIRFCWTYEQLAAHLRSERHARHADPTLSEDGMAELANWVVALGKQKFSEILTDPARIPPRHNDSGFVSELVEELEDRFDEDVPYNTHAWDPDWRAKGKSDPWS